jgi:hypothetical protein
MMDDRFKKIRSFLEAARYPEYPGSSRPDTKQGLHPFITISRQYGAGGHRLARELIEVFEKQDSPLFHDWQIFDRELCEKLLSDKELNISIRALLSEEYYSEIESLIYSLLGEPRQKTLVYQKQFELIRTLATYGKVIIVGRGGCCITESLPLGIHIRLTAPLDTRAKHMRIHGLEAKARVLEKDRDRARLLKNQFHRDISDPTLYDCIFNTYRVSFSTIAETVVKMIEAKIQYREKFGELAVFGS